MISISVEKEEQEGKQKGSKQELTEQVKCVEGW
jgi:hypothetical protein